MATTTTKPETLANGAELIGKMKVNFISGHTGWIILAKRNHGIHPFVTWLSTHDNQLVCGHYLETLDQAVESFNKRIAEYN